ncbi:MAG: NifB/NifX family molybdenum-iron cluster-binding protein [Colwellia sp.]
MNTAITEQVALRLGLAAKAVPQIELKAFVNELISKLGQPITEKKLRSLNPKNLYQTLMKVERDIERGQSNQVYAILTSAEISTMKAPDLPSGSEANTLGIDGPKLRVAVSSNNNEQLDGHFGSCLRFLIYEVNGTQWQLVEVRPVITDKTGLSRTDYLVSLIKDCHILSTLSIGGPAAAKVVRADLLPIKKDLPSNIEDVLQPLAEVIHNNPPPWMKKILKEQENKDEC